MQHNADGEKRRILKTILMIVLYNILYYATKFDATICYTKLKYPKTILNILYVLQPPEPMPAGVGSCGTKQMVTKDPGTSQPRSASRAVCSLTACR